MIAYYGVTILYNIMIKHCYFIKLSQPDYIIFGTILYNIIVSCFDMSSINEGLITK